MILAIDMGNSNIKLGFVKAVNDITEERIKTEYDKTSFQYASDLLMMMRLYGVEPSMFEGAVISSVVPSLTPVLSAAVNKAIGMRPMVVSPALKLHIGLAGLKNPAGLGADLVAAAEGAMLRYELPCIIVNMGTATTMTLLDADGQFRGGVILPGMKTSLDALTKGTASLPEIQLDQPGSTISFDTVECMRNGLIYGNASQIDGISERMEQEIGRKCRVVLTGGMAKFCEKHCRRQVILDDTIIMAGLMEIYRLNAEG